MRASCIRKMNHACEALGASQAWYMHGDHRSDTRYHQIMSHVDGAPSNVTQSALCVRSVVLLSGKIVSWTGRIRRCEAFSPAIKAYIQSVRCQMGSEETYVRTEDKTRGSEVCEGVTGSREGMSRMKTSCVQGGIVVHTGWRHHRHHAIIKQHASLSGSSRRHPTRHGGVRCVRV